MSSSASDWSCETCTLKNSGARTICEVCGAKKPIVKSKPKPKPPSEAKSRNINQSSRTKRVAKKTKKNDNDDSIKFLMDMGFDRNLVIEALKVSNNDQKQALDWLLAKAVDANPTPKKSKIKKNEEKINETKKTKIIPPKLNDAELKALEKRKRLESKLQEDEKIKKREYSLAELEKQNAHKKMLLDKQKEEKRQQRLQKLEREKAYEAKKLAEREERRRKRDEQEKQIHGTNGAIDYLMENYDLPFIQEIIRLCSKIIRNILANPKEEKYRSVKLDNPKVKKLLVIPLGPMIILKDLGFIASKNSDGAPIILMKKVNSKILNERLKKFDALLSQTQTSIPVAFKKCDEMKFSNELLYYCALDLRRCFQNVIAGSEALSFRQIDTESYMYRNRLSKFPPLLNVLKEFGYKPEGALGIFLQVTNPNIDKFQAAISELTFELKKRAGNTPITLATRDLLRLNNEYAISQFMEKFEACLTRIINTPHEQKYHRIKLKPFFKKIGIIDGGKQFFRLFGFEVDDVTDVATMPYPNGFDPNLLEMRLNDLKRAYKVELLALRSTNK